MGVIATRDNTQSVRTRPIKQEAQLTERQERVADMLLHRMTQRQIAKVIGVSQTTIHKDIIKIRKFWQQEMSKSYEAHVSEEIAKLDQLDAALADGIRRGDWKAIDTSIRLRDRKARLMGLDMPQKTEVHISIEALDEKIKELEAKAAVPEEEIFEAEIVEE
jgi:DNA-binding CsgD family transcriptional regulator